MSVKKNTCYWCGKPALTREHVPPRCFFPNETIDGKKWDKLITVRACAEHNNAKGQFDEYLRNRVVIASKTIRAQENINSALKSILRNDPGFNEISFDGDEIRFLIHDENIGFAIESIARALFYCEFDECFSGYCDIYYGGYNGECRIAQKNKEIIDYYLIESQKWASSVQGGHPDVFTYRFGPDDGQGNTPLVLCFYETLHVVVILSDEKHRTLRNGINLQEAMLKVVGMGIDPMKLMFTTQGYNALEPEKKGIFIKPKK